MSEGSRRWWQAINAALVEEMERDERVILLGEDVGAAGGTYGETRGLQERFGDGRVRDAPISEQALVGAGVGAALVGLRPVVEILFLDFLCIASDMLVNQAAKLRALTGGSLRVPLVVKSAVGGGAGLGAQHSQALEGWYAQIPGLTVVWPSTPGDGKGLLKSAIRHDDPVLFLESLASVRDSGPVGGPDELVPLGEAAVVRAGDDVTIVTYGLMRRTCLDAADLLAAHGISAEVVDLRTVVPWDRERVFASVARTHRCVVVTEAVREYGPGGEIASEVAEHCFDDLDAPVRRIGSPRVPAPHKASLEQWRLPQAQAIADEIGRTLGVRP